MPSVIPAIAFDWSRQVRKAHQSTLRRLEEAMEIQLQIAQSFADLRDLQLRGAASIRDWNGFQTYLHNQRTVGARFGERLAHDTRELIKLTAGL